tara:strand:+ start:29559 stop:30395 length:837 start_codon:yes stop_codon:yes gene_type:complete
MQDKIFDMLMKEEEITWQTILYDLVKSEKMDPWNIEISILTKRYMDMLKELKELDFRLSGKVVLAAAILLRIKSKRLVGKDLDDLDALFASMDETEYDVSFFQDFGLFFKQYKKSSVEEILKLIPRTPQPRKRKVSIYDLIGALEQAMEVKKRRAVRYVENEPHIELPEKKIDITQVIRDVYGRVKNFFLKVSVGQNKLKFSKLLPENPSKEDKVFTFIPLLHLTNQRKIDLNQENHFGEIEIGLAKKGEDVEEEIVDEVNKSKEINKEIKKIKIESN